jgi:hypothetical protein
MVQQAVCYPSPIHAPCQQGSVFEFTLSSAHWPLGRQLSAGFSSLCRLINVIVFSFWLFDVES